MSDDIMFNQFLGRPFDYWFSLDDIMNEYDFKTPKELRQRLDHVDWSVRVEEEWKERIKTVLIRSAGDLRCCPRCGAVFIPRDQTARDALDLYRALFGEHLVEETPLTDRFDEQNW